MKKITKKQEKQIYEVIQIWNKAGQVDSQIALAVLYCILTEKLGDLFARIERGETIQEIVEAYNEFENRTNPARTRTSLSRTS